MPRPTPHLTDGEVQADLRHPTSPDLLRRTLAAVGEHTDVHPAHDMPTVQVAARAGLVTGMPLAHTGSRAVQR